MTIKYKHVADAIERSFSKDCPITEDNVSIQGENGNLFTRSVGYFAAYKNAIQQLENAPVLHKSCELNAKIAKLSVEGHILSSRTAFIGVEKIDSNQPKPELNETSEVFINYNKCHSIYYAPCIYSDIMSGTGTISDDIIYDFFQKMKIDSTDNYIGASEIEIPDIGSNIAGLQNRTQYHEVDFGLSRFPSSSQGVNQLQYRQIGPSSEQSIIDRLNSKEPPLLISQGTQRPNPFIDQIQCNSMQSSAIQFNPMQFNQLQTNSKFQFRLPSRNFVNDKPSRK